MSALKTLAFAMFLAVSVMSGLAQAQATSFSVSKSGQKPIDSVTSLLWIEDRPQQVFADKKSMDHVERALFHRSQADLVTSSYVIDLALQQRGIMQMPVVAAEKDMSSWLQRKIFVAADPSTQLMQIGMRIDDPRNRQQILALVRAVTTAYLHVYHDQLKAQNQRESQLLSRALENLDAKRRRVVAEDRQSAEATILDQLWKDLYERSVQSEANALAGPRIRLLKLAGDGFDQPGRGGSTSATPVAGRVATPSQPEVRSKTSFFSKKR